MLAPIACCLEAPDAFVPKARWVLDALLVPLGLQPVWTDRAGLADGGLYYGPDPEGLGDGVVPVSLATDTISFFSTREAYDAADTRHLSWDGSDWPVLFPRGEGAPDPIGSAFFWLSGWDEWTTTERDVHGRFPYAVSLQAKLGCVEQPLVDVYRRWLGDRLGAAGQPVEPVTWRGRAWTCVMTHDIDLLRKRRLGTVVRALRRSDGRRGAAFRQAALDPNPRRASIARLAHAERERGAGATYFFKTAARSAWDVPYDPASAYLRRLVADLGTTFEIGLHPSYFAHDHGGHLREERDRLAALTRTPPTTVRQHFLRFTDETPHLHAAAGLDLDSTLGFSLREGFRRGSCVPFRLFDLAANRPLDVWELPLVAMDTTLFMHRELSAAEASASVERLMDACRRVGGCCVLLWHNTAYDEVDFPGQGEAFEHALEAAAAREAAFLSLQDGADTVRRMGSARDAGS